MLSVCSTIPTIPLTCRWLSSSFNPKPITISSIIRSRNDLEPPPWADMAPLLLPPNPNCEPASESCGGGRSAASANASLGSALLVLASVGVANSLASSCVDTRSSCGSANPLSSSCVDTRSSCAEIPFCSCPTNPLDPSCISILFCSSHSNPFNSSCLEHLCDL